MAIARNATSSGQASSSTVTVSHTVTGSNCLLLSAAYIDTATNNISGITYNGAAMTQLNTLDYTADWGVKLFIFGILLGTGDASAHDVVVTATSSGDLAVVNASYTGVSQSGLPDSAPAGSIATAASLTLNFTTIADLSWVFAMFSGANAPMAAGTGATSVLDQSSRISTFDNQTAGAITPAGAYSLQATHSSGTIGGVGVSFAPAVAAATSTVNRNLNLLGVGS